MWILLFSLIFQKNMTQISLEINGLETSKGRVELAIFNSSETFLDEKKYFKHLSMPIESGQKSVVFDLELPAGEYAFSAFHDENGNGKLDKNWVGIPTEAYGFSNNFKAKWGAPSWEKTRFFIEKGAKSMEIKVEKW
jgi:uncharacterized protein (DUF2141 family)